MSQNEFLCHLMPLLGLYVTSLDRILNLCAVCYKSHQNYNGLTFLMNSNIILCIIPIQFSGPLYCEILPCFAKSKPLCLRLDYGDGQDIS